MNNYQLITKSPLAIVRRHKSLATSRTRENLTGVKAPNNHAYILDVPRPETAPDGFRWQRAEPTLAEWGWEKVAIPEPTPIIKRLTKLTIKGNFDKLGKWAEFAAWMATNGIYDDWLCAQDVAEDHPLFVQFAPVLKNDLDLSDEDFDSLLATE